MVHRQGILAIIKLLPPQGQVGPFSELSSFAKQGLHKQLLQRVQADIKLVPSLRPVGHWCAESRPLGCCRECRAMCNPHAPIWLLGIQANSRCVSTLWPGGPSLKSENSVQLTPMHIHLSQASQPSSSSTPPRGPGATLCTPPQLCRGVLSSMQIEASTLSSYKAANKAAKPSPRSSRPGDPTLCTPPQLCRGVLSSMQIEASTLSS